VLIDGDTAIAPGITAIDTRGHTPGHQSSLIELPGFTVVLAFDAADLRANITGSFPCSWNAKAEMATAAQRSIDRLHALDALDGVEVRPCHDPGWWAWTDYADTRAANRDADAH
jgi:N-acyl homoserine lactone hydrolase